MLSSTRTLLVWALLGVGLSAAEKGGSCWSAGFEFDDCCAPSFGPKGNEQCWDDVYTFEVCCLGDGADPAEMGCNGPYFDTFRQLVLQYYHKGRMGPALINTWPTMLANFEARFEVCAPAVLQAILLQMEERALMETPSKSADRALAYAGNLQHSAELGRLFVSDKPWPLELGLDRVKAANRQRGLRLARVRHAGIQLVLSYCRENIRDWLNSTLSRKHIRHVDLVIVAKCPGADALGAVPLRHLWRSVTAVEVEDLPLRADECSAYLGYLAESYAELPGHLVFVHADAPEHIGSIHRPNILDDTLHALVMGAEIPFAHLGGNRVTMGWKKDEMGPLWRGLFGSSLVPPPGVVQTYCCSHFVVSRERVQLRPRSFYERGYEFVTSPLSYTVLPAPRGQARATNDDMTKRLVCQNMMFLWHIIFGEPLDNPHRMFDPGLPMFLKTKNIRTAYMDM